MATVEGLQEAEEAAAAVVAACDSSARPFVELAGAQARFTSAAQKREEAAHEADILGGIAMARWMEWHSVDAEAGGAR